jgi:chitodextrinase
MANVDKLAIWGGGISCPNGMNAPGNQIWTYNFSSQAWEKRNPAISGATPQSQLSGSTGAYDPNTGEFFFVDRVYLFSYNSVTNTITQRSKVNLIGAGGEQRDGATGVIDPGQKYYISIGKGVINRWNITSGGSYALTANFSTSGCSGLINAFAPGLAWDPVNRRVVGWAGGNTVYFLNTSTWTCTSTSFSGGPASMANGTYGRFAYGPAHGVFVTYNSVDANATTLRLSGSGVLPPPTDTVAPSIPSGVTATAVSSSAINLSWNASTDNVGVAGYRIYRAGSQIATSTTASYSSTGLLPSTSYAYTVVAYDAAGNESSQSSPVSAVTMASSPPPPSGSQTLTFMIMTGNDDVYEDTGLNPLRNDSYFGFWDNVNESSGLRFANVNISKGATIANAFLTVRSVGDDDSNTTSAIIKGIASDNAAIFTTANRPSQGPFTSAAVGWNSGPWSGGINQVSPNIAPIIQQIVSRSNWQSGNALALAIVNNGTSVNADRGFLQYESGSPATLTVTFTSGGSTPGDTTPPLISIATPTGGAVSGTITITANGSDNVGIAGVQFKVNGTNLGGEDTTSPYTASWNTASVANGNYTLSAVARDAAGNQASSTLVTVTVNNSGTTPPPGPDADFQARCSAPGVIKCVGFDSDSDYIQGSTIFPGDQGYQYLRDTSIYASGGSSLRFRVPANSSSDSSGYFLVRFPQTFGEGQDWYVQFRQRFSPELLNTDYAGSGGFKQHIFWHVSGGGSCTDVQLVTQNVDQSGYPRMYTSCGGRGAYITDQDGDVQYEFSSPSGGSANGGYWCTNRKDQPGENNCARYTSNEWLTFYYHIRVGTWGQPNSTLEGMVQYPGGPMKHFVNLNNFIINNDSPATKKFGRADLTIYQTGKSSSQTNPVAYSWYDEFILSTQPIATPGTSQSTTQPPLAPSNLALQ